MKTFNHLIAKHGELDVDDVEYFGEIALKMENEQLNTARLDGINLANKGYRQRYTHTRTLSRGGHSENTEGIQTEVYTHTDTILVS